MVIKDRRLFEIKGIGYLSFLFDVSDYDFVSVGGIEGVRIY